MTDKLQVIAADGGLYQCGGLGEVDGRAVAWNCTGHTPEHRCTQAYYIAASEGAHFADASGQCFKVFNGQVEACFDQEACPGDTLTLPSSSGTLADIEQD